MCKQVKTYQIRESDQCPGNTEQRRGKRRERAGDLKSSAGKATAKVA